MITFGLIAFENLEKVLDKINNIITPTIEAHPHLEFETICVDNSSSPLDISHQVNIYKWNNGENKYYAGAMNQLVQLSNGDIMVYICTNHGRMLNVNWLLDIIRPIVKYGCAMAGDISDRVFIQGGVFAAKISALKDVPYSTDKDFVHLYSDHYIGKALRDKGYRLSGVPSIRSVWRQTVSDQNYKYIHDW